MLDTDAYRKEVIETVAKTKEAGVRSIPVITFKVERGAGLEPLTMTHNGSGNKADFREILEKLHIDATMLHAGQSVTITGLQGRGDLNGRQGTVQRWVEDRQRYQVAIDGEETPIGVRRANLVAAMEGQSPARSEL